MIVKILQCRFYWLTMFKDTHAFCKICENDQKLGSISKYNMMPLNYILVIKIFNCCGIDFIGLFPPSYDIFIHIIHNRLVLKWIEAIPSWDNDHRKMIKFFKDNILSRFGIHRVVISDGGTYFCNKPFEFLIKKY